MPHHDAVVLAGGAILPCLCDAELLRSFDWVCAPIRLGRAAQELGYCLVDWRKAFVY